VRLILLGDVMLGRLVNDALTGLPPAYPWGDTLPVLLAADGVLLNLECIISDRGSPWPGKVFTFRSDARNVEVLKAARVSAVSLANNHTLDYGPDALEDCLAALRHAGIGAAGAGRTIEDAAAAARFAAGDTTVAVVAWTDNEPGWAAGPSTPGVFYVPLDQRDARFERLLTAIARAAPACDLLIVSAHWGPNWGSHPPPDHVEAAHRFIEAGADVVFGHSPHVTRGIELYRGRPIFYGCGDFIDDYAVDERERNDHSFIAALDGEGRRLRRLVLMPTVITRFQARLARDPEQGAISDRLRLLCAERRTDAREVPEGLEIRMG
jgi:poly-gamma-glutamate synthesis protein (capsule biosynthesis protein)